MSHFKLPKYCMHCYVVLSNMFYLFRVGYLKEQMVINLSAMLLLKVRLYSVLFILLYHYTIINYYGVYAWYNICKAWLFDSRLSTSCICQWHCQSILTYDFTIQTKIKLISFVFWI